MTPPTNYEDETIKDDETKRRVYGERNQLLKLWNK